MKTKSFHPSSRAKWHARKGLVCLSAAVAAVFSGRMVHAGIINQYFTDAGGPLTWDNGTTADWSNTGPTSPSYTSVWNPNLTGGGQGTFAYFQGTAGTVNVSGTVTGVDEINFTTDGYTLSGGTITLGPFDDQITTGISSDTISSAISSSSTFSTAGTSGAGTLILSGTGSSVLNLEILSGTTEVTGGSLAVSGQFGIYGGGNFVLTGGAVTVGTVGFNVGQQGSASGLSTATLSGGTLTASKGTSVGNSYGSYYIGGILNVSGATANFDGLQVGVGASGELNLSAGTINMTNSQTFDVGSATDTGGSSASFGVYNQTAGVFSGYAAIVGLPYHGVATGLFNVSGGSFTLSGSMTLASNASSSTASGTVSIGGGSGVANVSATTVTVAQVSTDTGTINLNANGLLKVTSVAGSGGTSTFNFNGGTLQAGSAASGTFVSGLTNAYIYGGGATIDPSGKSITISQALQAAPSGGYGLAIGAITLTSGGSGYIGLPTVTFAAPAGGGTSATGYATIGGTGTITGIIVTNPGSGYASGETPTVTITGGGGSGASASASATVVESGGGLTVNSSTGTGVLTLSGLNTYSGPTAINSGALLANNATESTGSGTVTVYAGGVLGGTGSITGPIVVTGTSSTARGVITAGTGTYAQGNTPGLGGTTPGLLTTAGQTWNQYGLYQVKMTSAGTAGASASSNSGAGTKWDEITMTSLALTSGFTVQVTTLGMTPSNFTNTSTYHWIIADDTTGGYTAGQFGGIATSALALDTSGFHTTPPTGFGFTLSSQADGSGSDLVLNYSSTPEPTSALLFGLGVGGLGLRRRRRSLGGGPSLLQKMLGRAAERMDG